MSYWKFEHDDVIPLSRPDITEKEIEAVSSVLRSGFLSLGPKLVEFEEQMSSFVEKKHVVAVNSGTSALFLALLSRGIGPGDEVIVPSFTFIATVNVVKHVGAIPVFADINEEDYNLNPQSVEELINEKTKAIIPVDVFGVPSDMAYFRELADRHDLFLLDDSCEALGAKYKGHHVGFDADVSTFAFYPNKQITTGEGGVLATDNEELADLFKSYRNQGRGIKNDWLHHVRIGYNFRLSDINAALGLAQLQRIDEILRKRRDKAAYYTKRFEEESIDGLYLPMSSTPEKQVSWFVYVIRLPDTYLSHSTRDDFIKELFKRKIRAAKYFEPVHLQPVYRDTPLKSELPVTLNVSRGTVAIPFFNSISQEAQDRVVNSIVEILEK